MTGTSEQFSALGADGDVTIYANVLESTIAAESNPIPWKNGKMTLKETAERSTIELDGQNGGVSLYSGDVRLIEDREGGPIRADLSELVAMTPAATSEGLVSLTQGSDRCSLRNSSSGGIQIRDQNQRRVIRTTGEGPIQIEDEIARRFVFLGMERWTSMTRSDVVRSS